MWGIPRGVLHSEWTKLRSLRSTYVSLAVGLLLSITLGGLAAQSAVHAWPTMAPADRSAFDAVQTSLDGATWAEFAFGVLGVLAVSSEYATGMIRTSLMAVPQRRLLLAAKVAVVGALALVLGELMVFGAFFVGQAILAGKGLQVGLSDPGVLRALLAAGGYLLVLTLVGIGLGALIRHTAGAVAGLFCVVYLAYGLGRALQSWSYVPDRWFLVNIGDSLTRLQPVPDVKVPSLGGAVAELGVYAFAALALAAWRFSQDA
jgi:ABC-2 type transport system permease protein